MKEKISTPPLTRYAAHYISGTHWDREWYRPFQEFRILLVEVLDSLLEMMEQSDEFRYFHLDGQTCVLSDYLEVRPENRDRLARLIRAGRILIGPWHTMPDLFCPGGESLVRNLLAGRRHAQAWGVEPMPVAYTCDMFGHPAQMPQIYRGFDLAHCVLGRGTNEHTTPAFFTWEALDGSAVFVFKLQDHAGYGAFVGTRRILEGDAANRPDAGENALASLRDYIQHEIQRTNGAALCLMDALDHMPPAHDAARLVRLVHAAAERVEARHSSLPAFFADAEKTARDVPTRRGELREPSRNRNPHLWLIPNCVSARIGLKQANDLCQSLLQQWAEPFVVWANLDGAAIPTAYLRIAWEQLLLNHAHDSICGCSIDQVHRDMMHRFDQVRLIAEQLRVRALGLLTAGSADLAAQPDEFTVTLANPVPVPRDEVVVFDIDLPADYPAFFHEGFRGGQDIKAFRLFDADGREILYQRLGVVPRHKQRHRFARAETRACDGEVIRYTVAAKLELPALGYRSIVARPSPTPVRRAGSLRTGPVTAENEYLAVAIAPNGSLTLTDKTSGERYCDLLTFEDRAELGDGWFHADAVNDEVALSAASPAQVSVIHDGPEIVTFGVAVTMEVPRRYDRQAERRSQERAPLTVVNRIGLRRGARVLDVQTVVDNRAEDHRLRLLLPTDVTDAQGYLAHQAFAVIERRIAIDPETTTWQEMEIAEKPFEGLQAVGAGRRGLAFLSAGGLHEGGVADDRRRTMLVTLLRSFRRTVYTAGEPDGLELGEHVYRYALMPFAGRLPRAVALTELARLTGGVLARQTGRVSSGFPPMTGQGGATRSFLRLTTGHLVLAAFKPAEDGSGAILRLWNPTERPETETLVFDRRVRSAGYAKLSEQPLPERPPFVKDATVTIEAAPCAILTLRVSW
jgi:alpha-mannosidase